MFLALSLFFANLPGTTRSVPTSYIGPVRGVHASYGVVLRSGLGFHHLMACF